ncbi:MAG: HlyD family efflux transporter periplasmic adaptor subunit [Chthoniobacteraceae bacterium]
MKIQLPIFSRRQWLISGASLVLLVVAVVTVRAKRSPQRAMMRMDGSAESMIATVTSGPFVQEVVERGEVQSSHSVEIRCEVAARGSGGVSIIEIVPEGSYVKEGDFLVKLDDSALQFEHNQQEISSNTSRSMVVEAQADYDGAKLAMDEYLNGPFRQDEQMLESEEFVQQEDVRRAEEYFRYSQRLAARGYTTEVQLEADRFGVEKARKSLAVVRTKLEVLRNFTKVKTTTQLRASVETSEARLRTRENTYNLDTERLARIKDYIAKCEIKAPCAGQVIYANDGASATNGDPLIAEGKTVRERQVMIRLPDPQQMRVLARVNEARIDNVKKGMFVHVSVDAFPDGQLYGVVQSVGEYPLPAHIPYSTVKEYAAEITIKDPPKALRSGMTAKVAIQVATIDQAVQVPLQAVLNRDSRYFCLVPDEAGHMEVREVELGLANDATVVIKKGLAPDERVLLAPQNYESQVALPPPNASAAQVADAGLGG